MSNYESTTDVLQDTVSDALLRATLSAARIGGTDKPALKETRFSHTVFNPNLDAPPQFSDLFDGADNTDATIIELNDKVDAWLAKYFPSINAGFKNVPDDWLIGVIGGTRPFGIDSTIFDLVWHRARDRAHSTVASEKRTLNANFSARGFRLPPGALVHALAQAEQRGTDAVLDVNREESVKDAEIKKDVLLAAVNIAATLKRGILDTSAEFFRNYYSVHTLGVEAARARASAYNSYYNALSEYYGVEVAIENLKLTSARTKSDVDNAIDRNRISMYAENGAAGAHAQASRGFSNIAAAAATAGGSLVAQIETGSIA